MSLKVPHLCSPNKKKCNVNTRAKIKRDVTLNVESSFVWQFEQPISFRCLMQLQIIVHWKQNQLICSGQQFSMLRRLFRSLPDTSGSETDQGFPSLPMSHMRNPSGFPTSQSLLEEKLPRSQVDNDPMRQDLYSGEGESCASLTHWTSFDTPAVTFSSSMETESCTVMMSCKRLE